MNQYLLLIHGNAGGGPAPEEWKAFFGAAEQSGMFRGGSELGAREILGEASGVEPSGHIVGFMRFDAADPGALRELLARHPVVVHGGSVELCEMPAS